MKTIFRTAPLALLIALIAAASAANAGIHYHGISPEQDSLARAAMDHVNALDWEEAEGILREQARLESQRGLPPLSYLLRISIRVLRLQNDEYENPTTKLRLAQEVDQMSREALALVKRGGFADSVKPTLLFIKGGIRGFTATLNAKIHPIEALDQGFEGLRCLDSARAMDPRIKDAYLGSGLFNCILSKYPKLIKIVLRLLGGHTVSLDSGLADLRICAAGAHYSAIPARQYLIQYLSPYIDNQAQEKRAIFHSLEKACPKNPYFLFLELDEGLCFYPDKILTDATQRRLQKKIPGLCAYNFSCLRYVNLVKWQYSLLDSTPGPNLDPDSIPAFKPFSYYPAFIAGLRLKLLVTHNPEMSGKLRRSCLSDIDRQKSLCEDLIYGSEMNPIRQEYFDWHISDGLKIK